MSNVSARQSRITKIRAELHALYLPRFDALCKNLSEDWFPYQGWRSFVEQDSLYLKGRSIAGPIVTNAKAGESAHNWGCASDWTIFKEGQPVWDHEKWHEYASECKRAGLNWGGSFKSLSDKPHNEMPLRVKWSDIAKVRADKGDKDARVFLERNLI